MALLRNSLLSSVVVALVQCGVGGATMTLTMTAYLTSDCSGPAVERDTTDINVGRCETGRPFTTHDLGDGTWTHGTDPDAEDQRYGIYAYKAICQPDGHVMDIPYTDTACGNGLSERRWRDVYRTQMQAIPGISMYSPPNNDVFSFISGRCKPVGYATLTDGTRLYASMMPSFSCPPPPSSPTNDGDDGSSGSSVGGRLVGFLIIFVPVVILGYIRYKFWKSVCSPCNRSATGQTNMMQPLQPTQTTLLRGPRAPPTLSTPPPNLPEEYAQQPPPSAAPYDQASAAPSAYVHPQMLPMQPQMPPPMQQRVGASVDELLTAAQLHAFCAPVRSIGVATTEDFQDVDDEDLIGCGLNKIQIKRLRRKLLEITPVF
jgi:hypothetical protein